MGFASPLLFSSNPDWKSSVARYDKTAQIFFSHKRKRKPREQRPTRTRTARRQQRRSNPSACCVDLDFMRIICSDPNDPRHNEEIVAVGEETPQGVAVTTATGSYQLPRCTTTTMCCYDAIEGVIVCTSPQDPLHGKAGELVEEAGNGFVYICFETGNEDARQVPCYDPERDVIIGGQFDGMSPPGGVAFSEDGTMVTIFGLDPQGVIDVELPVCKPGEICMRIPLCAEPPEVDCCYDAVNGVLQCAQPALNGQVPELISEGIDEQGGPYVVVQHADLNQGNRTRLSLCPEQPPPECCYDMATGRLRCPGNPEFDGLEVALQGMITEDMVSVAHPSLPGGAYDFPICIDETPPECCYDGEREVLVCPGDLELDGKPASVVGVFEGPDGKPWVSVSWEGGGAKMPLCTEECPPSFCCVNVDTMLFVCPDQELNGQPADVVDIITIEGHNFAVLSDGIRVPVCGRDCPPPRRCPPGLWMTPDGECESPPDCPPPGEPCPPGMWRDPDGVCRHPPKCPPQEPCPPQEGCPPQQPCPPQEPCPPGRPPRGRPPRRDCEPCDFPFYFATREKGRRKRKLAGNPKHGQPCCKSCAHGEKCESTCPLKNPGHRRRKRVRYRQTRYLLGL